MAKKRAIYARKEIFRILLLAFFIATSNFLVSPQDNIHAATVEHNLVKYPKSKMTRLTLKKVYSAKRPKGCGSLQGFAMTDKYYVFVMRPPGQEDNNRIEIVRRSDNKNVSASFKNPVYNVGHGNDATWNSKTDEVAIADGNRKRLFRVSADTFKYTGVTKLVNSKGEALSASGVAYDKTRDAYYTATGGHIRTFNSKNQLVASFIERHNQTNQGFAYNNGYLYRPTWESAGHYTGSVYDGVFKRNTTVIYQFGIDGSFTHGYYIDNPLYEVESMAFDENNVPYLAFNGPSGYYTVFKVTDTNLLKKIRQSYTISYFDNGGKGSPKEQTAYVGIEKKLSATKPTRTNYTFLGWSTNASATKASYSAGGKFLRPYGKSNANIKLYAVWKRNTYMISYDANGGTGAPAAQTIDIAKNATISSVKPTRTNYTFLGWATSATATKATYSPSASYTAKKSVTLYAVWKASTYVITYNANGGTGAPTAQTATSGREVSLSATKPTRSGFTFKGWATKPDATSAQYAAGAKYTGKNNVTLYAVWVKNATPTPTPAPAPAVQKITITYDANGGTGAPVATTGEVGKISLSPVMPTRAGCSFLGWSTDKTASSASYQPGAKYSGSTSATLYAVWKQIIIVISYDANGGTGAPASQNANYGQSFTISSTKPTRSGYEFLGWNVDKGAKVASHASGQVASFTDNTVLYAVWEQAPHVIKFDANGGTGAPATISTRDGEIVIPEARPAREGYMFMGWGLSVTDTEPKYQPGDIVKESIENVTFYAVWQKTAAVPIDGKEEYDDDAEDETVNDTSDVNGGEEDDTFSVDVDNPAALPTSGPAEVATVIIALVCVSSITAYWAMSKKQLRTIEQAVQSNGTIAPKRPRQKIFIRQRDVETRKRKKRY